MDIEAVKERSEMEEAMATRPLDDVISGVVGAGVYASKHVFPDLRVDISESVSVTSHALAVSRFYFTAGIVVDVLPETRRQPKIIAAKRAYCESRGLRYVLVADGFDEDGVRAQLAPAVAASPPAVVRRPRTTAAKRRKP